MGNCELSKVNLEDGTNSVVDDSGFPVMVVVHVLLACDDVEVPMMLLLFDTIPDDIGRLGVSSVLVVDSEVVDNVLTLENVVVSEIALVEVPVIPNTELSTHVLDDGDAGSSVFWDTMTEVVVSELYEDWPFVVTVVVSVTVFGIESVAKRCQSARSTEVTEPLIMATHTSK